MRSRRHLMYPVTVYTKTESGVDFQQSDISVLATSDTYFTKGTSGSPLVVGAGGGEGLLPTLGACVHHPLLPKTGLQSFTFREQIIGLSL